MKKIVVEDYDLEIKMPNFVNIIGMPNSGKTHLLKMLINQASNESLFLDDRNISEYDLDFKKKNLTACIGLEFNTPYVKEELVFYLEKCEYEVAECFKRLDEFADYFDMEEVINEKIKYLSVYDKAYIRILSLLILRPTVLGLDNLFSYLDDRKKNLIIKYAKENKITILNVTTNKEELLLASEIIILDKRKVKNHQKHKEILADEKVLASIGFELPFIINMSNGCQLYELTDKTYYDNKSLVGALWK